MSSGLGVIKTRQRNDKGSSVIKDYTAPNKAKEKQRLKDIEAIDNDLKTPYFRNQISKLTKEYQDFVKSPEYDEITASQMKYAIINAKRNLGELDAYVAESITKDGGIYQERLNELYVGDIDYAPTPESLIEARELADYANIESKDIIEVYNTDLKGVAKGLLEAKESELGKGFTISGKDIREVVQRLDREDIDELASVAATRPELQKYYESKLGRQVTAQELKDLAYNDLYNFAPLERKTLQSGFKKDSDEEGGSEETFGLNLSVGESTIKKPLDKAIETGILGLKDVRLSGLAAVVPYDIEGIKNPDVKGRTFKGRISELTINDEGEPVAIVNPDRGSAKQVPYSQIKNDLINTAKAKSSKRVLNSLMSKINEYESKVGQATKIGLDKAALEKDLTDLTDIVISDDSKAEKDNQLKTRFPNLDIEFDDANKTDVIINGKPYKAYSSFFGFSKDAAEGESKKELINALYQAKNYSTAKEGEPSNEEDGTEGDIKVGDKRKSGGQTVIYNGSEYVKEGGESDITLYGKKIQEGINAFAKSKNITISEAMAKLRAAKRIN